MTRIALGVCLAALLLAAWGGLAVAQPGGPGGPAGQAAGEAPAPLTPVAPAGDNTSERLPVANETARTAGVALSPDPAAATSMRFDRTRATFAAYELQEEVRSTTDSDDQLNMTAAAIDDLAAERDELYEAERTAYEAFAAGDIDGTTFAMRLARVQSRAAALDAKADELRVAIGAIDATDRRADVNVRRGRLRRVHMDVQSFRGPVGDHLLDAIAGAGTGGERVRVASTSDGYEAAAVTGSTYVREAYAAPNRARDGDAVFRDSEAALARTSTLYPRTFADAIGQEIDMSGGLFWSSVEHLQGTTVMYLDATTNMSFREAHELNLGTLEYRPVTSATADGLTVTVERTYPGGPARVRVTDASTGAPIQDVAVAVDGQPVGTTGAGGIARTVAPTAASNVTVTAADTIVELDVPVDG